SLLLLVPSLATSLLRARQRHDRGATALLVAPVLAAAVHALYVARVGGDFMHARLLLPSLFGLLLPVASVRLTEWPLRPLRAAPAIAAGTVLAWAIACALWFRVPYPSEIGPHGIADERGFAVAYSGQPHPMDAADYAESEWGRRGLALRSRAGSG